MGVYEKYVYNFDTLIDKLSGKFSSKNIKMLGMEFYKCFGNGLDSRKTVNELL